MWREYLFKCAPCDPAQRPCTISPYHYRLDWQIWFAAMATPNEYPWTLRFVWKLLHNDPGTLSLLAGNPFPEAPPRFVRARLYVYRFAPLGSGRYWDRELLGDWIPPLAADDPRLRRFLETHGWLEE
jgi:lipase maturation factor